MHFKTFCNLLSHTHQPKDENLNNCNYGCKIGTIGNDNVGKDGCKVSGENDSQGRGEVVCEVGVQDVGWKGWLLDGWQVVELLL